MINIQANQYRNRSVRVVGAPVRARGGELSPALKQAMLTAVCITVFVVLALGQVLSWQIDRVRTRQETLQEKADSLNSKQINLLARRAKLLSPVHVEAVAAVRLGLHAPVKGQVHRL